MDLLPSLIRYILFTPNSNLHFLSSVDAQLPNGTVERTLSMVREGEFVSRPGWEDVYTSMAKPQTGSKVTPVSTCVARVLISYE